MEHSGYDDRYEHTQGSLDRGESILEEDEEYEKYDQYETSPPPKMAGDAQPGSPPASLPPSGMGSLEAEVIIAGLVLSALLRRLDTVPTAK